jgi:hypothetical protein
MTFICGFDLCGCFMKQSLKELPKDLSNNKSKYYRVLRPAQILCVHVQKIFLFNIFKHEHAKDELV